MAFTDATETVVTYNLNGSQREFNIPFDYLSRSFVQVTVFGESTDKRLVVGDDYNYLDGRTISTVRALGGSDGWKRLQIRRYTSDDRIVDFKDGSVLKSADLNVAVVQALHIAAEGRDGKFDLMGVNSDGNWDALDRKINRLSAGTERRDAVNLGQMQDWSASALNQANRAKQEADNAARSAAAAKTSETNSKTSETNSKTSETNAKASENAAKSSAASASSSMTEANKSQVAAKTSETNAKASEGAANSDADRSYREAERAKGYADGMGHAVDIGYTIERMDGNFISWKGNHQWLGSVQVTDNPAAPTKAISMDCWSGGQNLPSISVQNVFGQPRYFLFPTDQNGYLVTDNYLKASVSWDVGSTSIRARASVGTPTSAFVVNNSGASYYHHASNLYGFHYQADNGVLVMRRASDYFSPLRFEYNAALGAVGGVEWSTDANGRPLHVTLWNEHNGQRTSNVIIPIAESGYVATREWVSSNFSNGSRLGPVITGTRVPLHPVGSEAMKSEAFERIMSQVPDNAVFCGVVFSNIGSIRSGAPKWRVIS